MTAIADLKEKVARKLEANPRIKTAMLADAIGVPEADVLAAMPEGYSTELDGAKVEEIIRSLEALETLYVVVRNAATVMEVKGKFSGFSHSGPFFNVASENLHMHLKLGKIQRVFAVHAPGREEGAAPMVSIQFFDDSGASCLKAFVLPALVEADGAELSARIAQWETLRSDFTN